jgi:hypothetical protein
MKSIDNSQTDNNTIRMESIFSEDRIKIIKYPTFLLVTWNLSTITKRMLENILGEEYGDLLIMLTLYRESNQQHFTDFIIQHSSDVLRLFNLPTGTYYCEIVGCNSRNETITVKGSNTIHHVQSEDVACTKYHWEQRPNEKSAWMQAYSGYTVYE